MRLAILSGPSRMTLAAFLAVALASSGVLAALGWLLLKQDSELAERRRDERLDQAADRLAAAAAQRSLGPTPDAVTRAEEGLPDNLLVLSLNSDHVAVSQGALLYVPYEPVPGSDVRSDVFVEGERLEFAAADYERAARVYEGLVREPDPAVSAGAVGRLARVWRRTGEIDRALDHYATLSKVESVSVEGFPAALFARLGRASALAEANRLELLQAEVRALVDDLHSGRWRLSREKYQARLDEAAQWLELAQRAHQRLAAISRKLGHPETEAPSLAQSRAGAITPALKRICSVDCGWGEAAVSPSGRRIASRDPSNTVLILQELSNGRRRTLTSDADGGVDLVWSPDDDHAAYRTRGALNASRVRVIDVRNGRFLGGPEMVRLT